MSTATTPTYTSVIDALAERYRARTHRSAELYARATEVFPGGDTRTGTFFLPYPTFMARGSGARMWDVDDNVYLDFLGNFTSMVHGHAHPDLTSAIARQAEQGTAFPFPGEPALRLAEEIVRRVPSVERLRFCNSGTEAVMGAVRAARAFTKRAKIVKIEGGYHGSADVAQVSVTSGADDAHYPTGRAQGPGVPDGVVGDVLVVPYNDLETTTRVLREHRGAIAAMIIEPQLTAAGAIPAEREYLQGVRAVTAELGLLLICDEIITLRMARGGAQSIYGLVPDLTTMGKIIGGGLPVGAFGGRRDVMATFDPRARGSVSHSGTFNANAATMAAGHAALQLMTDDAYTHINTLGAHMREGMQRVLDGAEVASCVTGAGSLAHIHFRRAPVRNYRDAARGDGRLSTLLHLALLERGFVCAARGMFATSTVMTVDDVDALIVALADAARTVLRPAQEEFAR